MIPERFALHTYAVMRVVFGAMFMSYGLQKLGLRGGQSVPMAPIVGVAMAIELIGGALIAIGRFTRPAAFLCFAFLHMAALGAGIWSFDSARRK